MSRKDNNTIRAYVDQGERFKWVQQIAEFESEYGSFGFLGVQITASIYTPNGELITQFVPVSLAQGATEHEFKLGGDITGIVENWQIGSYNIMEVMLYKRNIPESRIIPRAIQIFISRGRVRPPLTGQGEGAYPFAERSGDYNTYPEHRSS